MASSNPRDEPPAEGGNPSPRGEAALPPGDFANNQAPGAQPTLKIDEYSKRVESAQAAIGRSLLAMLALVAFWLAIENSYYKYVRLEGERTSQDTLAGARSNILEALRDKGFVIDRGLSVPAPSAAGSSAGVSEIGTAAISSDLGYVSVDDFCSNPPSLSAIDLRVVKTLCKDLADNNASRKRTEESMAKLQEESLDLSILGTRIPSRLAIAAEIWLVALLIWVSYFEAKRSSAHRNLAAMHLGMDQEERAFGKVPGATLWLSPVPTSLHVLTSEGSAKAATDSDLRHLLGWTEEAENRQVWVLRLIIAVLFLAVARLGYVALELTTDTAVANKFIAPPWQLPLTAAAVALVILSWFRIFRLAWRRSVVFDGSELPVLNRRVLLRDLLVLVGAVTATRFLRPKAANSMWSWPSTKKTGRNPRFWEKAKRIRRRVNRNVVINAKPSRTLVFSASKSVLSGEPSSNKSRPTRYQIKPRSVVTVHAIDKQENLRLLSAVSGSPTWIPLSLEDIDKRIDATAAYNETRLHAHRRPPTNSVPLNTVRTWPFEVQALGLIADGQLDVACDVLMRGTRLTLLGEPGKPVNLRLLDLLAGLAVRTGQEERYLKPLVYSVQAHIARFDALSLHQKVSYVTERRRPRHHCSSPSAKNSRRRPTAASATSSSAAISQAPSPAELVTSIRDLTKRLRKWRGVLDETEPKGVWWSHWSDQSKPAVWHHPLKTTKVSQAHSECTKTTDKQQVTVQIPAMKPLDIRG